MKTKTINLYSFDELSEEAKERAIDQLRPDYNFWQGENQDTLKKFCQIFPVKLGRNSFQFIGDHENMSGQRLATYIWNNYRNEIYEPKQYWICQGRPNTVGANSKHRNSKVFLYDEFACSLTGFYMDNLILAPIFDFMRKPDNRDFEQLMDECFSAWQKGCEDDFDFQRSDEQVIETIKSNDYLFTETGKLENL